MPFKAILRLITGDDPEALRQRQIREMKLGLVQAEIELAATTARRDYFISALEKLEELGAGILATPMALSRSEYYPPVPPVPTRSKMVPPPPPKGPDPLTTGGDHFPGG